MRKPQETPSAVRLEHAAELSKDKIFNPAALSMDSGFDPESSVLVVLAAGKGTRFGQSPKCIQLVSGVPLARHSIDAFRRFSPSPAICLVGYRHEECGPRWARTTSTYAPTIRRAARPLRRARRWESRGCWTRIRC